MSRIMATSTKALCVFILIYLATLGHQLEDPSSIERIMHHSQSQSSIKLGPKFPRKILHGIESNIDHGSMVKQEGVAVAELKSDVVDNSKGIMTSSEIRKKVRLLIEGEEHTSDRSRELDRDALYKSRVPNSDHSNCSHAGIGVCPPVPAAAKTYHKYNRN